MIWKCKEKIFSKKKKKEGKIKIVLENFSAIDFIENIIA